MSDTFKDIPEFFETERDEALNARTELLSSFRELGPPDLCHVVKSTGRGHPPDVSSYHYVSGVDASSSASLAAYLNSLTYAMEEQSVWFSKSSMWKVRGGTYCCFNAFSRMDVRVDVKIPGGVQAYAVDTRGERCETTPAIWLETYVSALLRAILHSDDPNYALQGYRKLEPITSTEGELRFLSAAGTLFHKGWQLGSDPEIQVASVVSNHLTSGVMKYFGESGRYDQAANLFEKLYNRDPEVASLLAQSYIGMNAEVKAVQIMAQALKENPQSYTVLHAQADFLRSKGKIDWATKIAKQAVNCAPSEFVTWAQLSELYIELGKYENALLTLNSCPMFTYNERDLHRMPTPAKTHLPIKQVIIDSRILDDVNPGESDADPALLRLPGPGLRGTFAKAYALLAKLVHQIGWDELLKTRSAVFVMEEEYRMQKLQSETRNGTQDIQPTNGVIYEDGTVRDDASTRAIRERNSLSPGPAIPSIKISSESDRTDTLESTNETENAETSTIATTETTASNSVERPPQAAASDDKEHENQTKQAVSHPDFSFSNKRLCERWLDNLFMVLYEDLRVWTIYRAEAAHFKSQHVIYRKTGTEWEILGDLGSRLHHKEEAKEAYQRSLDLRFSSKAWTKLLEMYVEEGDLGKSLNAAIRLGVHQHRWYAESAYPSTVARLLFKLGQTHGFAKIDNTLTSMGLPPPILAMVKNYLYYGKTFKVEGHDF